jgi:hypothetical protein
MISSDPAAVECGVGIWAESHPSERSLGDPKKQPERLLAKPVGELAVQLSHAIDERLTGISTSTSKSKSRRLSCLGVSSHAYRASELLEASCSGQA